MKVEKGTFTKMMLIACLLKSQRECGRTVLKALESGRCERAWGQQVVSVGVSVDSRGLEV